MRNKLKFLIGISLKKKIKSKWFLIANVIIALLVIGIINIDSIIKTFGGDFEHKTNIYIMDETKMFDDSFKQNLTTYEKSLYGEDSSVYDIKETDSTKDEIIDKLKSDEKEKNSLLIEIYYDESNIKSKITSLSTIDKYDYQIIVAALNSTVMVYNLDSLGITEEQYNKIVSGIEIDRVILDESITSEDENMEMIMTTVFPAIILPLFMLTVFLIQFIGTEINDEKSTRSMEIIISNVSPKTHFAAKIISNNVFIIGQVLLIFAYGVIGLKVRKLIGGDAIMNGVGSEVTKIVSNLKLNVFSEKLIPVLIFSFILMVLTFLAYSILAGILASMTTNTEDYQHVQTPLMIVLLLGYYLATMAGVFKGATFIKILSFVPLISSILSPSLLVLGQIGVLEITLSILIMVAFIAILLKYGIKIYKEGILNYSSEAIWKKIFKVLKSKD